MRLASLSKCVALVLAGIAHAPSAFASGMQGTGLGHPGTTSNTVLASSVVRVVGPGQAFTTIQAAVTASADGDIVLVKSGSYGPITIDGKGISVVADQGQVVNIVSVLIRNVPGGSAVLLEGLNMSTNPSSPAVLRGLNNSGLLRVDACTFTPLSSIPGASFTNCASVVIQKSTIFGGLGNISTSSKVGIEATGSVLALHDSSVRGAYGTWIHLLGETWVPLPAAEGITISGRSLFVSGGTVRGGDGVTGFDGSCTGEPPTPGEDGAVGIQLLSGATAVVLDASVRGGAGGFGGCGESCACSAPDGVGGAGYSNLLAVTVFSGMHASLTVAPPAREGGMIQLHIVGVPGNKAYFTSSPFAADAWTPTQKGARYFERPAQRMLLGTLNAGGTLNAMIPVPDLGPGVEGVRWFGQPILVDPAGQAWLGPPADLTLLDAIF